MNDSDKELIRMAIIGCESMAAELRARLTGEKTKPVAVAEAASPAPKRVRRISKAGREAIRRAQIARWAAVRKAKAPKPAAKKTAPKPAAKPKKKLSPAAKAKLVANLAKARAAKALKKAEASAS
jgi:hypothetical protein